MSDSTLQIRFGADASEAKAGAEEAKAAIADVKASASEAAASVSGLGEKMATSLTGGAAAAAEAHKKLGELAEKAVEAVKKVVEFAQKMGESAEQNLHAAEVMGVTADELFRLKAQATAVGVSFDGVKGAADGAAVSLVKARAGVKEQSDAFKQLHIDISKVRDKAELFQEIQERLAEVADQSQRAALAVALLGERANELAPLLNMSKEQLAETNALIKEFTGLNDTATLKGGALAESFNKNKLEMGFLNAVMTDALAPTFKVIVDGVNDLIEGFVRSYKTGGGVKQMMDVVAFSVKFLADLIANLGFVVDVVFKSNVAAVQAFVVIVAAVIEAVVAGNDVLETSFQALGQVILDVFTGHWDRIAADVSAGMNRVNRIVVDAARRIGKEAAEGFANAAKTMASLGEDDKALSAWEHKLWATADQAPKPKAHDATSGIPKPEQKEAKVKDAVAEMQAEFQAKELTKSNDQGGKALDSANDALDFWQKKRAAFEGSADDIKRIDQKVAEAKNAVLKQSAQVAQEVGQQELRDVETTAKAQLAVQKEAIQAKISALEAAGKEGLLSAKDVDAQVRALLDEQVRDETKAAQKIWDKKVENLNRELALQTKGTAAYQKALNDKKSAEDAFNSAVNAARVAADKQYDKLVQQQINNTVQKFTQAANKIGDQWRSTVEGLIQGTTSWRQVFSKIMQQMLDFALRMVQRMAVDWAAGEVRKTAASAQGAGARTGIDQAAAAQSKAINLQQAIAQVQANAAKAASGAYSSVSSIPYVGWLLAPEAAAAAYAAVLSFGALASAAGGWGQIPQDQLAMVHKDEMVLPATYAAGLRALLQSSGPPAGNRAWNAAAPLSQVGGFAASGSGGGHTFNVHAVDAKSFRRLLEEHGDHIARVVNKATRQNRAAWA